MWNGQGKERKESLEMRLEHPENHYLPDDAAFAISLGRVDTTHRHQCSIVPIIERNSLVDWNSHEFS